MNDLEALEGRFVGDLDNYERWLFNHAEKDGLARRYYEGGAGFMGLAKVRLIRTMNYPRAE